MSVHIPSPTQAVGDLAREHPEVVKVGKAGWFAKGVVYVLAGVLALIVASKASGSAPAPGAAQEASPTGALKTVAHVTGGALLLWLLAIGLILYAAWRLVSAALPGGHGAKSLVHRIGFVVSAVIYTTFAITAVSLARSKQSNPNGNSKVTDLSARVMLHSGGRLLIGVIGAIVMAVGLYRIYKGATMDVNDELDLAGMSEPRRHTVRWLGAIGEIGRGVGIGLVGFFMVRAAVKFQASQATGLDGALRRLTATGWGEVVVVLVGIGFVAYGAFCLGTFTRRRLQAP